MTLWKIKGQKKKSARFLKIVFIGTIVCIGIWAGLNGWIQLDAHKKAKAMLLAYPQATDEIEAAMMQMQSPSCTLKQRNRAVWVLGRLSDKKALPVLMKEYTGQPCQHDKFLCQSELKKAIRRCGGSIKTANP